MRRLKVIVASPDEALSSQTAAVLTNRGHRVVRRCRSSIETLEACFDERADLVVLDDELQTVSGTDIAHVLIDLRSTVATVVLDRAGAAGPDEDEPVVRVDASRPGYEAVLLNVVDALPPPKPVRGARTVRDPFSPGRAT